MNTLAPLKQTDTEFTASIFHATMEWLLDMLAAVRVYFLVTTLSFALEVFVLTFSAKSSNT